MRLPLSLWLVIVCCTCPPAPAYAQHSKALPEKPMAHTAPPPAAFEMPNSPAEQPFDSYQQSIGRGMVSFGRNIYQDLSLQVTAPFRYAKHNPVKFAAGALGLAAMIATDQYIHAAMTDGVSDPVYRASERLGDIGRAPNGLYLVAGLGVAGLVTGSSREKNSSLMLAEALITSSLWTHTIKTLSGRERPRERTEFHGEWEGPSFFNNDQPGPPDLRSFPSGHTTGAWATAAILAHQYPSHGIVPALAYTGATAMGYSRMVVGAHWLSDVVVGGLIGYGSARAVISAHENRAAESAETSQLRMGLDVSPSYQGLYLNYDF